MQNMERKPSEIISDFIDLMKSSHDNYNSAKQKVEDYNSRTYDWTHKLEDASNKQERNKIATAWQRELKERRKAKDDMKFWEHVHQFSITEQNKPTLNRLKMLLERQKTSEMHLETPPEEREYKGAH